MLDILRAPLPPKCLHTSKRLIDMTSSDNTYRLEFSDGTVVEADVVVGKNKKNSKLRPLYKRLLPGADGIHSGCRKRLQEKLKLHLDAPVYSKQVVYRALIPKDYFTPEMQDTLFGEGERCCTFRGPYKHILVFGVGENGRLLNVVAFIPEERDSEKSESW